MHIESLHALNAACESLLRERAEERGRDGSASLRQIEEALVADKIAGACLYDDAGEPCGIAVWRGQTYAQVLIFYVRAGSPPILSDTLVDYVFSELVRVHTRGVIEVRARDEAPGVRAAWQRHDFVFFERCRMVRPLGVTPLPVLPVPDGYRVVPWPEEAGEAIDQIAAAAYADSIESAAIPGGRLFEARAEGVLHLGASRAVLDKHGQVIGYIAVSAQNGEAQIVNLVVLPAHRRQGIGRALLVRAMTACQQHRLAGVNVAVTTRNPARQLYNQLGFRSVDCGEVAMWWWDGRQLRWRE